MLLDLVLFCCFLCIFPIRERFVLPKFVFCHKFGLYCFCCALSRSCRYHSKFRRFKPICFLVLFVLVVEMHHSVLFCPQMGPKNKTSFVQKRATNNLQLFTIGKHTQNSSVFPLTNKMTKSTKPTMTTQQ